MSQNHESQRSTYYGKKLHNVASPSSATEGIVFYDVKKDLRAWRKENTCQQCCIAFENFQVLLNHKCQPYRCTTCSTAFQHDFMLTMHQCHTTQSNSRSTHCCDICQSSFSEKSALIKHQAFCSKKKQCVKCGKQLPIRAQCDFCRKCRFMLEKDQKYSLRHNTTSKFRTAQPHSEEENNEFASSDDNKATAGHKAEELNHVKDPQNSVLCNLKRKRRSFDSVSENSTRKKNFDASADSLTPSDTSLDNLDAKCKFKSKLAKKDIESNLKNSLVSVLRNSSEKKLSDISSTSTTDLALRVPKTGIYEKPCNGISTFPSRNVKKNINASKLFDLDKTFSLLAYPRVRRSPKGTLKPCKENLVSKKHTFESTSTENVNENCLPVPKKPKRNCTSWKSVEPLTADFENKNSNKSNKPGESKKSSASSLVSVNNLKKKIHLKGKKNGFDQASVANSSLVDSNSGKAEELEKKSVSKLSTENLKEVSIKVNKSSPRLNSSKDSSSTDIIKSSETKKLDNSSSVRMCLRKSRKNIPKDEWFDSVKNLSSLVNDGNKSATNEIERCAKTVSVPSKNAINLRNSKKKIPEAGSDKNSSHEDGVTPTASNNAKVRRSSFGKAENSASSEVDKNTETKEIEKSNEMIVVSAKKVRKTIRNKKTDSAKSSSLIDNSKISKVHSAENDTLKSSKRKLKSVDNDKTKKVEAHSKKPTANCISAKNPRMLRSVSPSSSRVRISAHKQIANASNTKSKGKIVANSESSIDYTPELEISESTLNSVPDASSSSECSRYSQKNKNSLKNGKVSNSENDAIKLESLMNVLPDDESGILLRVSSNTTDNYRCLKCNKLFKTAKLATIHYGNCKTNRAKRNMIVSLTDILWVCVNCNFNSSQMSELSFHRKLCSKPSDDVLIDNCFKDYNNTCLNYCPKCSYSCISSIMFKNHNCKQRLDHMTKCAIDVEILSVENLTIQKYECAYCESTFQNYSAYKKHIEKHKIYSSEASDLQSHSATDSNASVTPEISSTIKQESVEMPEDVIKNWFDSATSSSPNSKKNSLLSTLNHLLPNKIEPLLCETAEKILERERKAEIEALSADFHIEQIMEFLQKSGPPSSINASTVDSHFSNEDWHAYAKDFGCRCAKHENAAEQKPCLDCLNAYIKKKGFFHQFSGSDVPACQQGNDGTNVTASTADGSVESVPSNFNVLSSMDSHNASSIHISSVSSCTNPVTSESSTVATSEANSCLSDIASFSSLADMHGDNLISNMQTELVDKFPSDLPPNSSESKLFITLILILKGNFVDSKYTTEKHNNLVKSIYELKFGKLADPYQVRPDQYYLLTECYTKPGDESSKHLSEYMNHSLDPSQPRLSYDEAVLQNYFVIDRPFAELMQLFVSQEPCDFDVVLCNNNHLFIHLSWQFAPEICYSAFCVKSDSEPTGIRFICGLCFDTVSVHLLVEHFDKVHEGAYTYNILIL